MSDDVKTARMALREAKQAERCGSAKKDGAWWMTVLTVGSLMVVAVGLVFVPGAEEGAAGAAVPLVLMSLAILAVARAWWERGVIAGRHYERSKSANR